MLGTFLDASLTVLFLALPISQDSQLLCDPGICWVRCDIKVNDSLGIQLNNKEEISLAEEEVND